MKSVYEYMSLRDDYNFILLGLALEWIKENRSVWGLEKINPTIMYRNELGPKK